MTRKRSDCSPFFAAAVSAIVMLSVVVVAVAQVPRAGQQSGKSNAAATAPAMEAGPLMFLPAVNYDPGGIVSSVVVADVNGDGKLDMVVTNYLSDHGFCCTSDVDVLLGNGDGTFQAAVPYYDPSPVSVAIADVNGDGKPDLIAANNGGSVGVLLGNGDGTFQPVVTYSSGGGQCDSVAVADVNGDGKLDLLVANYGSPGSLGVLVGNGDGTFQPVVTYSSGGPGGYSVAVVDVNGDGKPDLVLANTNTVGVLLGNGDGTFQAAVTYNTGGSAGEFGTQVVPGDVNGDGKPDLLVAVPFSNGLGEAGVLLGNGDGTFQPVVTYYSGGGGANAITVADVDGDGKLDLAVANAYTNNVGVLLGNGDGTFQPVVAYDSGNGDGLLNGGSPVSIAIGDTNGDGKPDLLVASEFARLVGALVNNDGAPPTTTALASSVNPVSLKQLVTYTATVARSGGTLSGTVTFADGFISIATVTLESNQASYSTSYQTQGSHAITASYSGVLHTAEGSRSATLTENVVDPTKTLLITSGSPTFVGQPVTFTTTVSSNYGPIPDGELVKFYDGTTLLGSLPLASQKATFTTSKLSAKTHGMKATYVGDTKFASSAGFVNQVVEGYPTTTTLTSSLNPSIFGQTVTMTSTVKTSGPYTLTGKVVFRNGTTRFGASTPNISGVATLTISNLNAGSNPLTAVYQSDANNAASTSAVLNQVVEQTKSSATITSSPNPSTVGQAVTFTAKVTSPTTIPKGPVTFTAGTKVLGTAQLSAGKTTFTTSLLPAGSTVVKVTYAGDSNIAKSSASVTQVVQP
jgi:hypothetical protein